jgi:hypothetical protein
VRLQVESQLESKNKEFDVLAEQFKKETALRKKYKNELEDLKGIALRLSSVVRALYACSAGGYEDVFATHVHSLVYCKSLLSCFTFLLFCFKTFHPSHLAPAFTTHTLLSQAPFACTPGVGPWRSTSSRRAARALWRSRTRTA